jgi:RHS repeat-associated protein
MKSWVGPLGCMVAGTSLLGSSGSAGSLATTINLYVGPHFEVRDYDQPAKYIFNGVTRVASVTGSLSNNTRIQRLRLYPGWNVVSLAVTATNLLEQIERNQPGALEFAYQWNPATADYSVLSFGQTVSAGAVLWLKAFTNAAIGVVGAYSPPSGVQVPAGGTYLPAAGLEAWTPNLLDTVSTWVYDSRSHQWTSGLAGSLGLSSSPPSPLAPGEAIFVQAAAPAELEIPAPRLRVRYYHQDHLGSSSVTTDAEGNLFQEASYYPFGSTRNEYRPDSSQIREPYTFVGKERDRETRNFYFETRFLEGALARFLTTDLYNASPDQMAAGDERRFQENPQRHNLYSYALNSPLSLSDPTGQDPEDSNKLTKKQRATVVKDLQTASDAIDKALAGLEHNDPKVREQAIRWFGKDATTKAGLRKIEKTLAGARSSLQYFIKHPDRIRDDPTSTDYAYVMTSDKHHLYIGQKFWTKAAKHKIFDTQYGTLIHENTHNAGTDDVGLCPGVERTCYGTQDALWLARHKENAARRNADNYEYFIESQTHRFASLLEDMSYDLRSRVK